MKQENAYKIKLLKLLEILRQDSDEDHYIGTTELIDKLADMGIVCDRRTLYKDIEVLNNFGYEVLCEKSPGKPNCYCVADRSFDVPELRILMDAVQAASFVTPSKTEILLDKIADLGGSHRAELLQSNIVRFNTTKSTNENIFYAISEINSAIENNKKVSFEYFDFNEKHERVYRKDHKRYFVNPLATIFDDDNYYLIAYYGKYPGVVHYRIDRMDRVEMVEEQSKDFYNGEPIDLKHHKKTIFGMFQGETQEVEFKADKCLLDVIFDVFGDNITLEPLNDNTVTFKAEVQVSPTFLGWCCSFGDKLKVLSPENVVDNIKTYLETIAVFDTHFADKDIEEWLNQYKKEMKIGIMKVHKKLQDGMFKRHGDDRDGGMSLLDENSQDDFDKWFKLSTQEKWEIENPSHMWEISCGHTHTMIHLYLFWDDGYWFYLSGGTHCLTTEVVRMYNAMKDKGVPVLLGHAGQIVDKLLGNDDLGIIPNNDMGWRYWYGGFPKEDIINFVQLSDGNAETVINNATWFDIDDIKLADK